MTQTVNDLLNQINLHHKIKRDDPVLSAPLTLFRPNEYCEVITVLWLYGEGWVKQPTEIKAKQEIGGKSLEEVQVFYNDVLAKIRAAFLAPSNPTIITSTPKSKWVNSTQITCWLSNSMRYKNLFHHEQLTFKSSAPRLVERFPTMEQVFFSLRPE